MPIFRTLTLSLCLAAITTPGAAYGQTATPPEVLLRLDDVGMNHSVNTAIERVARTGMPFAVSVMFACPWYQKAVEMLKKYPQVSVRADVAEGGAAEKLVGASRTASLLVVGTRGHGGLAGMLLGSVSQAVLRHADSPVVVAR